MGVEILIRIRRSKVEPLATVWMIYLTLMMAFVFKGSQQIYTMTLFFITIAHMIWNKKWKFVLPNFKATVWYLAFAIYVNLSRLWSVYEYNYTGITSWVLYITIGLLCLNYAFSLNSLGFFQQLTNAGALFSLVALLTSPISTYGTDAFSGITGQYRTWIGEISVLLFCANFCLYRYAGLKKKHLIYAFLNVITILASGARGALLLLIISGVYIIIQEKNFNRKVIYIFAGILAAAVLLIVVFQNNALYKAFVVRVLGAIRNDGSTQSINERWYFLQTAWNLFMSHPILGCGVDSMRGYLSDIGYWHVTYSHCMYVELLSSYGIVGTGLFFFPAIKMLFRKEQAKIVKYILPIMLLGFFWSVEYYSFIFVFLMGKLQFFENK